MTTTAQPQAAPKPRLAPVATHVVEVRLKADFADAEGAAALALLNGAGVTAAKDVRLRRVYELRGPLTGTHAQQIARELLCDPVTHEFRFVSGSQTVLNGMSHWRIEVWLKGSVDDPVGDTVRRAVAEMGLPEPHSVRVGLAYHVAGKCGRNQLEKAVARTLANPVIHRFSVAEAPLS